MTLDNEDGVSLSSSSNTYSFSDALSPSNQPETAIQQSNTTNSILGTTNTANLMNNMLNSILNKNQDEDNDDNLPSSLSSPESNDVSLNDESNEK